MLIICLENIQNVDDNVQNLMQCELITKPVNKLSIIPNMYLSLYKDGSLKKYIWQA